MLSRVVYPGTSRSIVDLGMVRRAREEGGVVSFSLVLERRDDPFSLSLRDRCESLLSGRGYVSSIEVLFPGESGGPLSLERTRRVIAISSGKGGVGKSTVSSNLAVALAVAGYRVGLLDADIFGPSIPWMFGAGESRARLVEVDGEQRVEPVERHGVKLLSMGFFVAAGAATAWRGPMASNALKQMVTAGNWGDLDYLLVDLPPGTSDIHLTVAQEMALSGAIVVSTPQQVALADAARGISLFASPGVDVPVLGIVENMSWFTPAELPANRYYLFGREGGRKLAGATGVPLLGQIPLVQAVMEGGESGRPVVLEREGIAATAFRALAARVVAAVDSLPGRERR